MAAAWRNQISRKDANRTASTRRRRQEEARPVLQLPVAHPHQEIAREPEPVRGGIERGVAEIDFYI